MLRKVLLTGSCLSLLSCGGGGGGGQSPLIQPPAPPQNATPVLSSVSDIELYEEDVNVVTLEASDPDGDVITFGLEGADSGALQVDTDGVVTFIDPPDYENPVDDDADNVYLVTATASDGTDSASQSFSVTVLNHGRDDTPPDTDNDGVIDDEDAFPFDPDETLDTDFDGIGNNADDDDDGDGALDDEDAFPLDPNESVDTDGDGIGNNEDTDDDNDGTPDIDDRFPLSVVETVFSNGPAYMMGSRTTSVVNDIFLFTDFSWPAERTIDQVEIFVREAPSLVQGGMIAFITDDRYQAILATVGGDQIAFPSDEYFYISPFLLVDTNEADTEEVELEYEGGGWATKLTLYPQDLVLPEGDWWIVYAANQRCETIGSCNNLTTIYANFCPFGDVTCGDDDQFWNYNPNDGIINRRYGIYKGAGFEFAVNIGSLSE